MTTDQGDGFLLNPEDVQWGQYKWYEICPFDLAQLYEKFLMRDWAPGRNVDPVSGCSGA